MRKQSFTEELKEHLGALEAKLEAEIGENIKLLGDLLYYEEMRIPELERQLAEARAEIESKSRLIEQMRDALQEVMVLCDAVPTRAHDMAKDYHLREIGRIVNVKGLYRVVKAALSAAERGE